MKRDMDLIRAILLTTERASEPVDAAELAADGSCGISEVAFHAELLRAHGLIEAKVERAFGRDPVSVMLNALTWEGYDYLDAIRSDKVWVKAKRAIAESVGDTSLSVIKDTCSALALATIKANLGTALNCIGTPREQGARTGAFFMPRRDRAAGTQGARRTGRPNHHARTGSKEMDMTDGQQTQPPEPHGGGEPAARQQPEPHGDGGTDWKAEARKWEQRAKENGSAAAELEALRAQSAADAAQAVRRAEQAEAEAAALKAAAERARTVAAVAAERGVSAAVLERMAGDGEREIRANAEVLLASAPAPAYPTAPQGGTPQPPAVTREQVMGIANSRERLRAIADNIDLF